VNATNLVEKIIRIGAQSLLQPVLLVLVVLSGAACAP